jgi:hypothetical protein
MSIKKIEYLFDRIFCIVLLSFPGDLVQQLCEGPICRRHFLEVSMRAQAGSPVHWDATATL